MRRQLGGSAHRSSHSAPFPPYVTCNSSRAAPRAPLRSSACAARRPAPPTTSPLQLQLQMAAAWPIKRRSRTTAYASVAGGRRPLANAVSTHLAPFNHCASHACVCEVTPFSWKDDQWEGRPYLTSPCPSYGTSHGTLDTQEGNLHLANQVYNDHTAASALARRKRASPSDSDCLRISLGVRRMRVDISVGRLMRSRVWLRGWLRLPSSVRRNSTYPRGQMLAGHEYVNEMRLQGRTLRVRSNRPEEQPDCSGQCATTC